MSHNAEEPQAMFPITVIQSLTAIACLACMQTFGAETGVELATASTIFVYCSLGPVAPGHSETNSSVDQMLGSSA